MPHIKKEHDNLLISSLDEFDRYILDTGNDGGYACALLPSRENSPVLFPTGTLSYIGARTGRGKTTMLVSIAMDALRHGKNVLFVTSEESPNQILFRMILNEAFSTASGNERQELLKMQTGARGAAKEILRSSDKGNGGFFRNLITGAKADIGKMMADGKLAIFDGPRSHSFREMMDTINMSRSGRIVLIDYIQHLRIPDGYESCSRQVQIQETSHQIADSAMNRGIICIAGAQFGRTDEDKKQNKSDIIAEGLFREAGDIEQDAHIAIGIGRSLGDEERGRFYCIMKSRDESIDGKNIPLLDAFAYSYTCASFPPKKAGTEKPARRRNAPKSTASAFLMGARIQDEMQ